MKTKVQFANAGTVLLAEIFNEIKVNEDGWAHIAPLGDHPGMALVDDGKGALKKVPAIQRIDKASCEAMAAEFKNTASGLKRFMAGRPIYVGHPDVPGYESKYPDKTPKGVFSDLKVDDNGLWGKPVFTNEGSDLVQGEKPKYKALSGRWNADDAGEDKGTKIFRPTVFLSAGLTNQPNLPVQLLNEKDDSVPSEGDGLGEKGDKDLDDMNPAERAEALSQAAHTSSNDAHAATRKSRAAGATADDHVDAFHKHAAASFAHTAAANAHKDGGCPDNCDDHTDMAEEHQMAALKHFRTAKKMGKEAAASAEASNEKTIIDLANTAVEPMRYTQLTKTVTTLVNDKSALETEKATFNAAKTKLEAEKATLVNERDSANTKATEFETTKVTLQNSLNTVTAERDAAKTLAETQFKNERDAHIVTLLDHAVKTGRISHAERPVWTTRLGVTGQFANEKKALENLHPTKVKTVSITMDRDGKRIQINNEKQRVEVFNELVESTGKTMFKENWNRKDGIQYNRVFNALCASHQDVVGVGDQPEIKRR